MIFLHMVLFCFLVSVNIEYSVCFSDGDDEGEKIKFKAFELLSKNSGVVIVKL